MVTMTFIYVLIWIAIIDLLANYLSGHLKERNSQKGENRQSGEKPSAFRM